jgi:hypothetical protein
LNATAEINTHEAEEEVTGADSEANAVAEPLTGAESDRLLNLEDEVEKGLRGERNAGRALRIINRNRLYREVGTFEEYVKIRFDISKAHAYRLINDHEELLEKEKKTSPQGDKDAPKTEPTSERQRRELRKLDDEMRAAVDAWVMKCGGYGEVTAQNITDEIARLRVGEYQQEWDDDAKKLDEKHGPNPNPRPKYKEAETVNDAWETAAGACAAVIKVETRLAGKVEMTEIVAQLDPVKLREWIAAVRDAADRTEAWLAAVESAGEGEKKAA